MALILCIETATEICSVALGENEKLLVLKEKIEGYRHASQLTLLIQECLAEAGKYLSDLDAVAVSNGPGSYTGLRIGVSTAKGICYGQNVPLISVGTLESLAVGAQMLFPEASYFIPMIDARRMEVYTAIYDSQLKEVKPAFAYVLEKNAFSEYHQDNKTVVFSGNGVAKSRPFFRDERQKITDVRCSARYLCPIASQKFRTKEFQDIAYYVPFYLKSPNITKPKKVL